jgi:hypothetical protein
MHVTAEGPGYRFVVNEYGSEMIAEVPGLDASDDVPVAYFTEYYARWLDWEDTDAVDEAVWDRINADPELQRRVWETHTIAEAKAKLPELKERVRAMEATLAAAS